MADAITAEGLGKRYRLGVESHHRLADAALARLRRRAPSPGRELWALRDLDVVVPAGEVLGVIGRNGSGKSTLLKVLSRITPPSEGTARLRGRVSSLLEVGTGFHPDLTGRDNILLNGAVLGMRRREILAALDEIVEFSGLAGFVDTPVKRYSSGMYVRLAFSVAAHLRTEVMLVDEVLAVGDLEFQRRCLGKMGDVARSGRTIVFVSHDLAAVQALCDRALVLDAGRVVHDGPVATAVRTYAALQEREGTAALAQRTDRTGAGGVRAVEAWLEGPDGTRTATLVTGQPATVVLRWERRDGRDGDLDVALGLYDELRHPVSDLWSSGAGAALSVAGDTGEVRCHLERVPLNAGRFVLNLQLTRAGVVEDAVSEAVVVEVARGDWFGTGKVSPQGTVVIDQRWSAG